MEHTRGTQMEGKPHLRYPWDLGTSKIHRGGDTNPQHRLLPLQESCSKVRNALSSERRAIAPPVGAGQGIPTPGTELGTAGATRGGGDS